MTDDIKLKLIRDYLSGEESMLDFCVREDINQAQLKVWIWQYFRDTNKEYVKTCPDTALLESLYMPSRQTQDLLELKELREKYADLEEQFKILKLNMGL